MLLFYMQRSCTVVFQRIFKSHLMEQRWETRVGNLRTWDLLAFLMTWCSWLETYDLKGLDLKIIIIIFFFFSILLCFWLCYKMCYFRNIFRCNASCTQTNSVSTYQQQSWRPRIIQFGFKDYVVEDALKKRTAVCKVRSSISVTQPPQPPTSSVTTKPTER